MPEDQLTLLLQRVRYLERALALQTLGNPGNQRKYESIIEKLKEMVRSGEITTYLGIDSIFYHLKEQLERGSSDLDKSAQEIRDFIS